MKFLDQAKVHIKSGDGGAGCCSFRREAYVEYGGPDGGDGGRGGHVIAECVDGLNTLIDYRYKQHFKAKTGNAGAGRQKSGAAGADIVLKLPKGTQILEEDQSTVVADLVEVGQTFILARGGDGGFGNLRYKTSTNRSPRKALPGWPGLEKSVWLRLKLIADVGLVGLPNAGKSTLLSTITRAKPKIADYPFTTLHPNLGVVGLFDKEFVMADIHGLIKGAHRGLGLGDRFLGHIERCNVLLHLIDGTQPEPLTAYETIRRELAAYGGGLTKKFEIVAITKADALTNEQTKKIMAKVKGSISSPTYLISAPTKLGIQDLLSIILEKINKPMLSLNPEAKKLQEETGGWAPI